MKMWFKNRFQIYMKEFCTSYYCFGVVLGVSAQEEEEEMPLVKKPPIDLYKISTIDRTQRIWIQH